MTPDYESFKVILMLKGNISRKGSSSRTKSKCQPPGTLLFEVFIKCFKRAYLGFYFYKVGKCCLLLQTKIPVNKTFKLKKENDLCNDMRQYGWPCPFYNFLELKIYSLLLFLIRLQAFCFILLLWLVKLLNSIQHWAMFSV